MAFESRTGYVKDIIMNCFKDNDMMNRKDIVAAIKADSKADEFSDGVIAGSFKILVNQGMLVPVARGIYSKGTVTNSAGIFDKICKITSKFEQDLEKASTFSVLDMSDDEKAKYKVFTDELECLKADIKKHLTVMTGAVVARDSCTEFDQVLGFGETGQEEQVTEQKEPVKITSYDGNDETYDGLVELVEDTVEQPEHEEESEHKSECCDGNDETYDGLKELVEDTVEQSEQVEQSEKSEDKSEQSEQESKTQVEKNEPKRKTKRRK